MSSYSEKDDDDYVRPPDEVYRERLIDDRYTINRNIQFPVNYEKMDDDIINTIEYSSLEYDYEKYIQAEIERFDEIENRKRKLSNFDTSIKRISKYDTQNNNIYITIQDVLNEYIENGFNIKKQLSPETIEEIHKIIFSIRIPVDELDILRELF
jgi:hypothetical protein